MSLYYFLILDLYTFLMHDYPIYNLPPSLLERYFAEIPQPPKHLFIRGTFPDDPHLVFLTVVGTRKYSSYGEEVCRKLIAGLKGYPIVIVSGLAHGIDRIAHEAALDAGLITIGFPGSGLGERVIYPRQNVGLAEKILHLGGCLISEDKEQELGNVWSFPKRNRLLAGLSRATLLIEAVNKSGSRITAKYATDYNRDVLTVPGSIFSETSEAPHELLKLGATPITSSEDLLEALGFQVTETKPLDLFSQCTPEEESVLKLLAHPKSRGDLIRALGIPTHAANILLSQMEIKGLIKEHGGDVRRV